MRYNNIRKYPDNQKMNESTKNPATVHMRDHSTLIRMIFPINNLNLRDITSYMQAGKKENYDC